MSTKVETSRGLNHATFYLTLLSVSSSGSSGAFGAMPEGQEQEDEQRNRQEEGLKGA